MIGLTVSQGQWRAVAHRTECLWFRRSRSGGDPVPKKMPIRLCRICKPTLDAVMALAPDIWWYPYSPSPGQIIQGDPREFGGRSWLSLEVAEAIAARRERGWNKTGVYREGWN